MIDAISRALGPLLDLNLMTLDGWLCRLRYGNGCRLRWINCSAWTGGRVYKLLRTYGIRAYALESPHSDPDHRGLRVPKAQGRWAEYVLLRAGVPLVDRPGDPGNRNVLARPDDPYAVAWGVPARGAGLTGLAANLFLPFVGGVDVPVRDKSARRRASRRPQRRRRHTR